MATVKLDDFDNVEDLALELGATVEYADGRRFNTAGVQSKRQAKPSRPTPAPPPPPVAAPPQDNSAALMQQIVQQLSTALSRPVSVMLPEMPVPQVTVAAAPTAKPISWSFEFERNPNGTIKRINATPKE